MKKSFDKNSTNCPFSAFLQKRENLEAIETSRFFWWAIRGSNPGHPDYNSKIALFVGISTKAQKCVDIPMCTYLLLMYLS